LQFARIDKQAIEIIKKPETHILSNTYLEENGDSGQRVEFSGGGS